MDDVVALIDARTEAPKAHSPYKKEVRGMSKVPVHLKPDEARCDMLASYSADELVAGKLIQPEQWDFAMRIIRQQAHVLLISNCYPNGNPNSN